MLCHIDIETFSWAQLGGQKGVGVYRYTEELGTEILCVMYAFDDGLINVWLPYIPSPALYLAVCENFNKDDLRVGTIAWGKGPPTDLSEHIESGGECRAYNSEFERVVTNGMPGQLIGFPPSTIEQWVCVMAKASVHGLPRKLEKVAQALDTDHQKDATGHTIMLQLCRPRKKAGALRWTPEADTGKYLHLYSYCIDDVLTERAVDAAVPELPPRERELFLLDQKINQRGVMVDLPGVNDAKAVRDQYKDVLKEKSREVCGLNPTQTGKLQEWVTERYKIPNLQAPTIDDAIRDPKIPAEVKQVLRIRRSHEMKAPSKLDAMLRSVCEDDRLHGMLKYYGAGTGRWASLLVQLQNLFRGVLSDPETAIEILKARDLDWLRCMYDEQDPMQVLASVIRGMLIAAPGKSLVCVDYSAIEARVVAWLAGQEDKLEVFRTHGKVYEATAAKLYSLYGGNPTLEQLMTLKAEYPDERFIAKSCELALQFQGGWHALYKNCRKQGRDIEEDFARETVYGWRDANEKYQDLWANLETCFRQAIVEPGSYPKMNKLIFHVKGDWLYMQLPTGRRLAYYKPSINNDDELTYLGIDTFTRQWKRVVTYGGRLTNNAGEGIARDVMTHAMPNIEAAGYPIICTVHDEMILEVVDGFGSVEEVAEIACRPIDGLEGLPVKADGFRAKRYKKDQ